MDPLLTDLANGSPKLPIFPLVEGYAIGLGLIMAIGAQGLFVLRQGLTNEHLLAVCLLCSLSDLLLITAGITAFALLSDVHWLPGLLTFGGILFLLWYGYDRIRSGAAVPGFPTASVPRRSLRATVVVCLALTWLNPHVYFDTVFLIGGLASRYVAVDRIAFGVGACSASISFFFALGYGARLLAPRLQRPNAWRTIDIASGLVMWILAANLATHSTTAHFSTTSSAVEMSTN